MKECAFMQKEEKRAKTAKQNKTNKMQIESLMKKEKEKIEIIPEIEKLCLNKTC